MGIDHCFVLKNNTETCSFLTDKKNEGLSTNQILRKKLLLNYKNKIRDYHTESGILFETQVFPEPNHEDFPNANFKKKNYQQIQP